MKRSERKQAIDDLYAELARVMIDYAECVKRDDFFEIKRKLLGRLRQIEKEIQELNMQHCEEQLEKQSG